MIEIWQFFITNFNNREIANGILAFDYVFYFNLEKGFAKRRL